MNIKDRIELSIRESRPGWRLIAIIIVLVAAFFFWQGWKWRDDDFIVMQARLEAQVRAAETRRDQAIADQIAAEERAARAEEARASEADSSLETAIINSPAGTCVDDTGPLNLLIKEANK